jgi:hypothetical protein
MNKPGEQSNEYMRDYMRGRREDKRTVKIPPCKNPGRRKYYLKSLWLFGNYYFKHRFYLDPSPHHRALADRLDKVVCKGGNHAVAMPRGSAKTTWLEIAVIYAVCKGKRKCIVPVCATGDLAENMLQSIKVEFESNDLLYAMFPEICEPIKRLGGVSIRGKTLIGQDKKPINLVWKAGHVEFAHIKGSPASGTVIKTVGIESSFRGMKVPRSDGKNSRPDLVLIDDPQTRESAKSPGQCESREKIIAGDIVGMAGPGRKIAALLACTVIEPDDLAARMLNRKTHPKWQGETVQMVSSWADRHNDLWMTEYSEMRRNAQRDGDETAKTATEFYREHREEMDRGCKVYWEARHNDDEISAIQNAYNLLIDYGEEVFYAEYQNAPKSRQSSVYELSAETVASKINHLKPREFPGDAFLTVGFIDLNQMGLHWGICAFRNDMTASVAGYGVSGEVWSAKDPKGETEPQAFFRALKNLCDSLLMDGGWSRGGGPAPVDLLMVDCGYLKDVVFGFCRQARYGTRVIPSRGRASLKYRPSGVIGKPGDNWFVTDWSGSGRVLIHNSDYHRMHMQRSFLLPAGAPGSTTIYGEDPRAHYRFAEQLTAEKLQEYVRGDVCDMYSWVYVPGRRNDWLDCMTGCRVGAAFCGAGNVLSMVQANVGTGAAQRPAASRSEHKRPERKTRRW